MRARLRTGRPGLVDADGLSLLPFVLVGLSVVALTAGFVASATGDGPKMALCGGALLGLFDLPGIVPVDAGSLAGRGSRAPVPISLGTIALLTLAGSLPPLALLLRRKLSMVPRTA